MFSEDQFKIGSDGAEFILGFVQELICWFSRRRLVGTRCIGSKLRSNVSSVLLGQLDFSFLPKRDLEH